MFGVRYGKKIFATKSLRFAMKNLRFANWCLIVEMKFLSVAMKSVILAMRRLVYDMKCFCLEMKCLVLEMSCFSLKWSAWCPIWDAFSLKWRWGGEKKHLMFRIVQDLFQRGVRFWDFGFGIREISWVGVVAQKIRRALNTAIVAPRMTLPVYPGLHSLPLVSPGLKLFVPFGPDTTEIIRIAGSDYQDTGNW